ncbi:UNVERIFIED_CONTAM: hypothetical protein RMT77_011045 [Armadillidium vulgare]
MAFLVIGDSEVEMFERHHELLREEWNADVRASFRSGRTLLKCEEVLQQWMTEDTRVVLIWALTCMAWEMRPLYSRRPYTRIAEPKLDMDLSVVGPIMTNLVNIAKRVNSNCQVFLVIPTIKDLYTFNQKKIIRKHGMEDRDMLLNHPYLNPYAMRDHSIKVYEQFGKIATNEFSWPHKRFLKANHAINRYYSMTGTRRSESFVPLHTRYLRKETEILGLQEIMADGLHGNREFLKWFIKGHDALIRGALQVVPNPGVSVERTQETDDPQGEDQMDDGTEEILIEIANPPSESINPGHYIDYDVQPQERISSQMNPNLVASLAERRAYVIVQNAVRDIAPPNPSAQDYLDAINSMSTILEAEKSRLINNYYY